MHVALVQMDSIPENPSKNLKTMERIIIEAKEKNAEFVLFHEGTLTDYVADVDKYAEEAPI